MENKLGRASSQVSPMPCFTSEKTRVFLSLSRDDVNIIRQLRLARGLAWELLVRRAGIRRRCRPSKCPGRAVALPYSIKPRKFFV